MAAALKAQTGASPMNLKEGSLPDEAGQIFY